MASTTDTKAKGPTANVRPNRLPAPTLFVGPPSRNASQLSISRQVADSGLKRDQLLPQKSGLPDLRPTDGNVQLRKPSEQAVEAKWRAMQSTLDEVELTAQSSTHVFGERHAAALDQLRNAQVELARAWGRGNEQSTVDETEGTRKRADTVASASTQLSSETSVTAESDQSNIEQETIEDIRLANMRRVANEAYFKKVDENVKAVVAKLEAVADAMRGVEGETKSLWSDSSISHESVLRREPTVDPRNDT